MGHIIGIDVASEVSSAVCMTENGRVVFECNVATGAETFRRLVKSVKRPRAAVLEECCEASWLYTVLEPLCDDVFVCNPKKNKDLSGHSKTDRNDAFNLADRYRGGHLYRVWHGGKQFQTLRERLRLYQSMTQESTALKNKIKAVFRSRGIKVGNRAYSIENRKNVVGELPFNALRDRVLRLGVVLDVVTEQRALAKQELIQSARRNEMCKSLKSLPGIGDIFAATIAAEVGTPFRFRSRKQFWAYIGLSITVFETAEYTVDKRGSIKRKDRRIRTRGLVRQFNRTLKGVFKQVALILCRSHWKDEYQRLIGNGVNPNNARLTIARKAAAIALHLAKTGELYDEKLVFARK